MQRQGYFKISIKMLIGMGLGLLVLAFVYLNNVETWWDFWENPAGLYPALVLGGICFLAIEQLHRRLWHIKVGGRRRFLFLLRNCVLEFLLAFVIILPPFLLIVSQTTRFVVNEGLPFSVYKVFTDWYNNRGTTGLLSLFFLILGYNLFHLIFYNFQIYRQSRLEAERLRRQKIESQYAVLKSQISPHFLFNSLHVLSSLVYRSSQEADTFIQKLAGIFQYVLQNSERDLIPLAEEIAFIEAYLYLLKVRFGQGLDFDIRITPLVRQHQIPPLTLQLLVENAIKHNEVSEENPLKIEIFWEKPFLQVANKLQKREYREESLGIGLNNLKGRFLFI
ncbi:MAG: histidine kinase, partial [Bacteroidota bacterium]